MRKNDILIKGDNMIDLYMVRHGRTLFNEKDRVQGFCDSPLTQLGLKQAQNVGKHLNIAFTIALSSPSERAVNTCEVIIQDRLPIRTDTRIKEMNFGNFEGEMNADLWKNGVTDFNELVRIGWVEEGGENEEMIMARIASFFQDLENEYEGETILLTSHGMWIDFALKYMQKENYYFDALENGSVSHVRYVKGKWEMIDIGNATYKED